MNLLNTNRPLIMGVLNITPDSFSDGGQWLGAEQAIDRACAMAMAGADIVDVGGESTRPGADPVSEAEELARVIPVVGSIADSSDVPVSIDTSKPVVMRKAVAAGAVMINDVNALRTKGAVQAAAELGVPVCLMHMQGEPRTMQAEPAYEDVVAEVEEFLLTRADACIQAGVEQANILLDPGFGFGKSLDHNLALLRNLPRLAGHGYPVLAGLSRKSMLGAITGREVEHRLAGSLALALLAAQAGAAIVRVHDVAATRDALDVLNAVWPPAGDAE